jgi:autotransporter-associated beta strand protein
VSLAGPNTSAATTLLEEGVLAMDNPTALGIKPVVISSGATLKMDVVATLNQSFELVGDGVPLLKAAIDVAPNVSETLNGPMLLDAETTFYIGQASALLVAGALSGTGPVTQNGPGEIELAGTSANTYTGGTFVNQGSLVLDKNNIVAAPGNVTIGTITPIHTFGTSASVGCTGNGAIGGTTVTVNGGSLYELIGNNQSLVNVTLNSGGSISTGGGTLTLTGASSSTVVAVNPGNSGASIISGNLKLANGGNISVGGRSQFVPNAPPELDLQGILSDGFSPSITKSGAGEMRLSAINAFYAPMTVNDGKLTLSNNYALGNSPSVMVNSNGTLALEGGIAIQNIPLTLNSSATPAWQSLNGSNYWTDNVTLTQTAAVDIEPANGYLESQGLFSGPGGLTAIGLGTLDFEGNVTNTYAGVTTVGSGVVEGGRVTTVVKTNPATGRKSTNQVGVISIPGDVVIGSDATNSTVGTLRFPGLVQNVGTANLTVHRSGLLDLSSLNGPSTWATLTGSGLVNVGPTANITLRNTAPFTFYGDIDGAGGFSKDGSGTMTTWGNINVTGNILVFDGDWELFGARHNGGIGFFNQNDFPRLGGDGVVDGIVNASYASIGVDSHFPDHQGGTLTMGGLAASSSVTVQLDMFGPSPTGGNDQIVTTSGGVSLFSDTILSTSFSYPPREGDVIDLISVGGQPFTGNFSNFPDGIVTMVGTIPVLPSYEGGSGHDFTLTVTNLPLAYVGYQLREGNGNQTVEPNECNLLYITLANRSPNTVTITNAFLRATNATGVVVTTLLATYPSIPAGQTLANLTPFQFSTDTNLACGGAVGFELVVGVVDGGQFAIDFSPVSGTDCSHPTGPCDSCTVVSGQLLGSATVDPQPLYFVGAPSICFPPKAYPGINPVPSPIPAPYLIHNFTNGTTNLVCITAQLDYSCPGAPTNALGVAAYLGEFDPNNPSVGYLGDIGQGGPPYPAFSFQVPAETNFSLVVMEQATNLSCGNYTLALFGLTCPPPTLAITNDTAPGTVRVNWSTAYPGFAAQQSRTLGGTYTNTTQTPVILNSRYSLTNLPVTTNYFYRLKK